MNRSVALPWDDGADPEARIRAVAYQISGLVQSGELTPLDPDARRLLASLPLVLLSIAGDARLAMPCRRRRHGLRPLTEAISRVVGRVLFRRN